jgi:hypothetical protein
MDLTTTAAWSALFALWVMTVSIGTAAGYALWRRELRNDARRAAEQAATHEFYRVALDRLGKTLAYGTPDPPPARIEQREDAELALRSEISTEMLRRGMADLRQGYKAAGLPIPSDRELQIEIEALVSGNMPESPYALGKH